MAVIMKLAVVESDTMEMESTRTFLQKEMLPSISWETWHPNSSTGNGLSLSIQPHEKKKRPFVNFLDYVNPNPKIISKEYQAECIQNEFPLDSLFRFPSFYDDEKMWKILLSELVHDAAIHGGLRQVFLRKSENRHKTIVQCTIRRVRYKVYGEKEKKVTNARNNFKVKDIGSDRLHADDIKKNGN
jgi:hypothetical protein